MQDTSGTLVPRIKVWDIFVRVFHWSLVTGFAVNFVSGEMDWMTVHVWVGYGITLLLLARIGWGLVGSRYARFSSCLYSVTETLAYARGMLTGRPPHYLGHNPLGALMVFALLGLCLLMTFSGLTTLAMIEFEGPLVFLNHWFDDTLAYAAEDIHEILPWVTLGFVGLHITGVIASSRLHQENLVKSMITGYKSLPPGGQ